MSLKKTATAETITVTTMKPASVTLRIIGFTPMFQNRMTEKAKQYFLTGGGKKTAAEKVDIKHDPIEEFRSSIERMPQDQETAIGIRVVAIKAAMCDAAIDTKGVAKTEAQRLLFMPGELVAMYGTPQLRLDIVRSADMKKTPDLRSRAFFPKWGAEINIQYMQPRLNAKAVVGMLANAGQLIGIGDFRQQKGKGSFGLFRVIADEQDDEWDDLVANHGKAAQLAAIRSPGYANDETAELMEFFHQETIRRAA